MPLELQKLFPAEGAQGLELSFSIEEPSFDLSVGGAKGVVARRVTLVDQEGSICGDGVIGRL